VIAIGDHLRPIVIDDRCTPATDTLNTGKIVPIAISESLGEIAAVDNRYASATDDRCANFSASTCPTQLPLLTTSSERVQAATRKISSAA